MSWPNPLVEQRADPWVVLHSDGYYYFTGSHPAYDRIELRRSRTLDGLKNAETKAIWWKRESGPMSHHIWAPELHHIDGKWYVYFAAGQSDAVFNIRMYALETDSANPLEGEWVEKGRIETDWDSFSLDATTFEHCGQRYYLWAQHDPQIGGNTNLYIARMDSPTSIIGPQVMLTKPEYPWEIIGYRVNEGPAILKRNGRIFLTYSASATDHHYCMGLLTASEDADLLNPASWNKSPVPVFKTHEGNRQFGPGHNSFTTTPDGKTDVLVFHARSYKEIVGDPLYDPNRHARAQVIHWRDDGTPDLGSPQAEPLSVSS